MNDRLARKTRQGFFSRIANSIAGVFIGFLLVPASIVLITWNEYRTIHRTLGLVQAEKVVTEVSNSMEVMPELDNRLVHVIGMATTEELLTDNDFEIGRRALRLERQVEMYQWVEHKENKTQDKIGGGKETVTTYDYRREWHRDLLQSESFEQPSGHTNPQPKYLSTSLVAKNAMLGAFHLRAALVSQLSSWKDLPLDEATLFGNMDESKKSHHKIEGSYLHFGTEAPLTADPKIGDLRIQFRLVEPMMVSLISQQRGREFEAFKTSNGELVERIESGERSATEMFDSLRFANTSLATILRIAGWLMACIGFSLMAGPLKALANIIPLLGKMVGAATMIIGFILGSTVALITISVAWIAVRPIFSLGLLAISGVGIYLLFRRKKVQEPPMAVLVD